MDGPVYRTWRRRSVWNQLFGEGQAWTLLPLPKGRTIWVQSAMRISTTDIHKAKERRGRRGCLTYWSGWIRLLRLAADFHKHTHERLHQFIARDPDTTPREHGGYFCSFCCFWSCQQQQKQLQWKTKKKNPQLPTYSKLYSKFIPRWGNDTSAKLKGHRDVATHSLHPCKGFLARLKKTQNKLHTKITHSAGS